MASNLPKRDLRGDRRQPITEPVPDWDAQAINLANELLRSLRQCGDEDGGMDGGLFLAAVHLTLVSALKQLPPERQLLRAEEFSQKLLEAVRKNVAS